LSRSDRNTADPRITRAELLERPEYVQLRAVLREELSRQHVSEREVSLALGKDHAFLNKVLRGERSVDFIELIDLARYLGIAPEDLVRRSSA